MGAPLTVNADTNTKVSDSCNCVTFCCIPRRRKHCHKHTNQKIDRVSKVAFEKTITEKDV